MDALQIELAKLRRDANLSKSIEDVDSIIEQLERAREAVAADPETAETTLRRLQTPLKNGFDKVINEDMKKIYGSHNKYQKALDKTLPVKNLPTEYDALASQPSLINRAIAMHLLREGQFDVAQTFISEALDQPPPSSTPGTPNPFASLPTTVQDLKPSELQGKFADMYSILNQLQQRNLHPAIEWARANSEELDRRGSNLEFELSKLQYLWLFQGAEINGLPDDMNNGLSGAIAYARHYFPSFPSRHTSEVQKLITAVLYRTNLASSPYFKVFDSATAWSEVSTSFTREFCFLLGLSAESPLYITATAGAIALPTLLKLASIVKEKRTEWTTQDELPVEIALPRSMIYHAIFVCPVSKEQTTEQNPPMMMPCGHVVAKESLMKLSKGGRFKCPYCPNESHTRDAKQITL